MPDTTPLSVDFSVSGLVNSDTVTSIMLAGTGFPAQLRLTHLPGRTTRSRPAQRLGTGLGNYIVGYVNGNLTLNQGDPDDHGEQCEQDLWRYLRA